jgi:hypothetical protein
MLSSSPLSFGSIVRVLDGSVKPLLGGSIPSAPTILIQKTKHTMKIAISVKHGDDVYTSDLEE